MKMLTANVMLILWACDTMDMHTFEDRVANANGQHWTKIFVNMSRDDFNKLYKSYKAQCRRLNRKIYVRIEKDTKNLLYVTYE